MRNPTGLASSLSPGSAPAIYFDCGTTDEFLFHAVNVAFDAQLTSLGIPHVWNSYVGGHMNEWSSRYPISLAFLLDAMAGATSAGHAANVGESELRLSNSPNPVPGSTTFDFSLPRTGTATLSLYDVHGRLIRTLVDRELPQGAHQVHWDAKRLPVGVYFSRLRSGDDTVSRKVVVTRSP